MKRSPLRNGTISCKSSCNAGTNTGRGHADFNFVLWRILYAELTLHRKEHEKRRKRFITHRFQEIRVVFFSIFALDVRFLPKSPSPTGSRRLLSNLQKHRTYEQCRERNRKNAVGKGDRPLHTANQHGRQATHAAGGADGDGPNERRSQYQRPRLRPSRKTIRYHETRNGQSVLRHIGSRFLPQIL